MFSIIIQWVSLYSMKLSTNAQVHHESEEYNTHRVKKWREKVKLETLSSKAQWKIWSRMRLNEKIEGDLLRNSDITKTRLSLLYSQWIDDHNDKLQPQMVQNASFFANCIPFQPGIIKEISFSSCGRLLIGIKKK